LAEKRNISEAFLKRKMQLIRDIVRPSFPKDSRRQQKRSMNSKVVGEKGKQNRNNKNMSQSDLNLLSIDDIFHNKSGHSSPVKSINRKSLDYEFVKNCSGVKRGYEQEENTTASAPKSKKTKTVFPDEELLNFDDIYSVSGLKAEDDDTESQDNEFLDIEEMLFAQDGM